MLELGASNLEHARVDEKSNNRLAVVGGDS
jgi:hypothetical protein